jgi:hypothetical protein
MILLASGKEINGPFSAVPDDDPPDATCAYNVPAPL